MKIYDKVKVVKIRESYNDENIKLNDIGKICVAEIRVNSFYVRFETGEDSNLYKYCDINIEDLELVQDGYATDEMILEELPKNNPKWWCKVEDGYIMNLLGEKKNKIPYDYNS